MFLVSNHTTGGWACGEIRTSKVPVVIVAPSLIPWPWKVASSSVPGLVA
jgi:hypothetical protein